MFLSLSSPERITTVFSFIFSTIGSVEEAGIPEYYNLFMYGLYLLNPIKIMMFY